MPKPYRPFKPVSKPDYKGIQKLRSSSRWQKVRARKLAETPLCECCKNAIATECHHRIPLAQRIDLAFHMANLMSLCHPCHDGIEKAYRKGLHNE